MTEWHRLFGIVLTDFFKDSPYVVELEKDLSLKQQFVDVIIIEQDKEQPLSMVPDGLDNLGQHNVLSYKSHQESFTTWACDELLGHYVNYRKQVSPSMDKLLPSEAFRLYGVSTRYPQKLAQATKLTRILEGVYELTWGSQQIRLIVLSQILEAERNAVWQLFSGIPDHISYGASHYQWHIEQLSTVIYELYTHYRMEGIPMPYTVKDYYRDFTKEHLDWLSPEERLQGIELKKRIQDVPPDDILKTLFPDDTGEHVDAAKLERYLQQLRQNPSGK
jgi:hypothetical protein